ncbi:hypothetical protein BGW36DRAFT_339107 [Talaromyces proteolyticus]|uniref:Chromatin SPT2 n=1 Tax=Talaromyces proteolyticus TaxID=1131652 RepID=A0AAD4KW43_9EURO|nr:uncharacterized protein BGW36DRAFT_339107 [Talaromyces proteolyticus]KAH8701124.1 hypothetical protein BGW36DRAFT_339107 [Talaromyces proteolyticus]
MSFLNSILSSIDTGRPSVAPVPETRPAAPVTSITSKPTQNIDSRKPTPPSTAPIRPNNISAGTKRKAEATLRRPDKPPPSSTNAIASRPRPKIPASDARPTTAKPAAPAPPSKPPPKGSFADLMAKAKAVQKEAPKVGVLKHQAALPKEKLSKSEKKKRIEEAMAKEKEARRSGKKSISGSTSTKLGVKSSSDKSGAETSTKRREVDENTYKGTSRPTQPAYKGTAGLAPRHREGGRDRHRAPRRDEYMGTDEEDEGDYYNDYDGYYSDESSDMEAGLEDMEREEFVALRTAEKEDAEDMRQETEAKKAKLERKQKLAALARSRR